MFLFLVLKATTNISWFLGEWKEMHAVIFPCFENSTFWDGGEHFSPTLLQIMIVSFYVSTQKKPWKG